MYPPLIAPVSFFLQRCLNQSQRHSLGKTFIFLPRGRKILIAIEDDVRRAWQDVWKEDAEMTERTDILNHVAISYRH